MKAKNWVCSSDSEKSGARAVDEPSAFRALRSDPIRADPEAAVVRGNERGSWARFTCLTIGGCAASHAEVAFRLSAARNLHQRNPQGQVHPEIAGSRLESRATIVKG